ncbi:hypothetical protein Pint_33620 [Pistacia integerrima]|uniref:Uncharacterized protein n=1 Tax=Pistacia integerrima TaxID=434235 RepID=A0ACC0X2F6_9ROSI|nr:hypothetical protein Pint_33620 [Pistacia integerrima]
MLEENAKRLRRVEAKLVELEMILKVNRITLEGELAVQRNTIEKIGNGKSPSFDWKCPLSKSRCVEIGEPL